MTGPLALAAALALASGRAQLPDRLPKAASADFAIAGDRAQLEPAYRKRALGLDFEGTKPNSHFYDWSVIPSWGQGVTFYFVDRRTGDVWGGYVLCKPIHSPQLSSMQARFRRRYHISAGTVRRIEREGSPDEDCQP